MPNRLARRIARGTLLVTLVSVLAAACAPATARIGTAGLADDLRATVQPSGAGATSHATNDPDAFNGGWHDNGFDDLVRQAAGEPDPALRAALYEQADWILAQQYPHIPLYHYEFRVLVKPYVRGYTPARVLGVTPLRTMSLDARR